MSTSWSTLCNEADLPDGEARAFEIDGARLCLVNDAGEFFCVDDLCTHGRAFLSEGYCDTEDCVVECPLHGGLFDYKTGEAAGDPAEKPVKTYPVRIEDGQVQVQL